MKKLSVFLCCALLALCLAACGKQEETPAGDTGTPQGDRKIGVGHVSSLMMDGTDKTRVKSTVAAVVLDKDGRIVSCELDELDFMVTLSGGAPQSVSDLTTKGEKEDAYIPTKEDIGADEGLTTPWHEQVDAFCDYAEGKMVGELTGLATTDGKSTEIEGCDLVVTDFIQAVSHAAATAKTHAMAAGDDLELAITAIPGDSTTNDKVQYTIEMAAVALDDKDAITGCMTDTLDAKLTIQNGVFTTVSGPVESKRDAGDAYGMKEASGIKREWYEQADAFDTYVRGKTAAQLADMKLGTDGKTDAISGCTISVTSMLKNVVKAARK